MPLLTDALHSANSPLEKEASRPAASPIRFYSSADLEFTEMGEAYTRANGSPWGHKRVYPLIVYDYEGAEGSTVYLSFEDYKEYSARERAKGAASSPFTPEEYDKKLAESYRNAFKIKYLYESLFSLSSTLDSISFEITHGVRGGGLLTAWRWLEKRYGIPFDFSEKFYKDYQRITRWAFRLKNYVSNVITEEEVEEAKRELSTFKEKYVEFYDTYAPETDKVEGANSLLANKTASSPISRLGAMVAMRGASSPIEENVKSKDLTPSILTGMTRRAFLLNATGFIIGTNTLRSQETVAALVQLEDPTIRADINIFYVNHKIATGFKEHIPALDRILKTAKKEGKKILVYFEDAVLDPFHTRKEFELYFPEFDMNRVASDSLYEEAFAKFYPFYLDYKDEQLNSQDVLLRFKDVEGDDFELSYLHFFAQKIMDERYPLEMHYERPPFEYIRFIVQTAIERERCGKSGDEFLAVIAFLAERNMYLVNKRDEKLFADITARIKALRDESCVFIIRGVKHQYLEVLFLEAGYATTSFVGEKIMKEYEDMIKDSLWEEDPLRQLEQVRRLKDKRRNNVLRKSVYDFVRHPVIEILRKWHIFGGLLAIGISFLLWWRYQREKKIKQIINETSKKSDDSISKNNRGSLTSSPIVFQQTQGFASLASSPIEENVKSKDLTPSMQCPAVNLENTKKDVLNSFYCGRS
ncbi:MAG: hypothetical protein WA066_06950, partial [Candidatus Omnitrophota bacterium]